MATNVFRVTLNDGSQARVKEPDGIHHPSSRNKDDAEYEAFLDEVDEHPQRFIAKMEREVEMKEKIHRILCKNVLDAIYTTTACNNTE